MVGAPSCPERGITTLEMIICLAILGLLASGVVVAESRDFGFCRDSHDRTAALRACSARLEALAAEGAAPEPGERVLPLPPVLAERFPGAVASETVRDAGPGLVEVEVRVRWKAAGAEDREALLRTLIALEPAVEGGR